ncbi:MAG: hypothetical protein KKG76_04800 [Euryarchaeota archaeon]|nr:hypothetical protein [Euryarchaeota archaeon]
MVKSKEKKVFCSLREFKQEYFPKSIEKQKLEESKDARDLGISWAKESLDKLKDQLKDL